MTRSDSTIPSGPAVCLESHYGAWLVTLCAGSEPDVLVQSDWDWPGLAQALGCPWALHRCADYSRAIEAADRWLSDNEGIIDGLPACAGIYDYFDIAGCS